MKNVICYLFGHKEGYSDGGYNVCGRCGKHEYYDYKGYRKGLLMIRFSNWLRSVPHKIYSWYLWTFKGELPF